MLFSTSYQTFLNSLYNIYDKREAENIANIVFEEYTSTTKIERLTKDFELSLEQESKLNQALEHLLLHKPLQQVLGFAWFYKDKFIVDENVLIPRPETEELVDLIIIENKNFSNLKVLDIGTGSGCIPISLKKYLNNVSITSIDISTKALSIAEQNAKNLNVEIEFFELDFLNESLWKNLECYDIIVSNPPYISLKEANEMNKNVLGFEPHIALFTPNDDYFIFYKKIAAFAQQHLKENGRIYVEINEHFGKETLSIFNKNFDAFLIKDMQHKDRMIVATKKN